jgi:putative ABC transport system substrate-binding protein
MIATHRRSFLTLLGTSAAASAWPLAARAQQPGMPVVGVLNPGSPEASVFFVAPFLKGLSEAGYVEGRNVTIEYRWAHNDIARLPELAADLVRRQASVIATTLSAALVAKAATTTIPIVFQGADDPVQVGLVASLNRPGANVTGITSMNVELMAKRLGLLHELLPGAARFAVLVTPTSRTPTSITDVQAAVAAIGRQIEVLSASTIREIDAAFGTMRQKRAEALLISPSVLFSNRRVQLVTLAARHGVPAVHFAREFPEAGGLMSYGTSLADQYRQVGIYTGRILKGEKPADLPVMRATKFEFVINLGTARALGIEVPPSLLAITDEVIE